MMTLENVLLFARQLAIPEEMHRPKDRGQPPWKPNPPFADSP